MSKVVYVATFNDRSQYVGFCDANCRRLKPYKEGRVGFAGRLKTKFQEQNRCWKYTAPVYVKARTVDFTVEIIADVPNEDAAEVKRRTATMLQILGQEVLNTHIG
jgi:hypothetical protein